MIKYFTILFFFNTYLFSQDLSYKLINDINYRSEQENKEDKYIAERCNLDIYYPTNKNNTATVIFFMVED